MARQQQLQRQWSESDQWCDCILLVLVTIHCFFRWQRFWYLCLDMCRGDYEDFILVRFFMCVCVFLTWCSVAS